MPEHQATDGPAPDATTAVRLRAVLRRRAVFVTLAVVLTSVVAWGVSRTLSPAHVAESVLVVTVGDGPQANPDQASRLAATFAALIPVDTAIDRELDRELGSRRGSFTVDNDVNTSLLRIRYRADDEQTAIRGASAVARQISRGPSRKLYASGSVHIARLPTDAPASLASPLTAVLAGLLGGLVLGVGLALVLERVDRRIDSASQLAALARVPIIGADTLTDAAVEALLQRADEATGHGGDLALVSASRSSDADTRILAERFSAHNPVTACLHENGKPAAWTASTLEVCGLVVRSASREGEVRQELALLRDIGPRLAWIIFVPRGIGARSARRA